MHIHKRRILVSLIAGAGLLLTSAAFARTVIVNGVLMGPLDIAILEWVHGDSIPDGNYWLDFNTGLWGYAGGPAVGVIGEDNDGSASQGCGGSFQYDCIKDNFCNENPGIC